MNNIVIFGPVHSGKTTLAGYIHSYYLSKEEFNMKEDKIKKELEERNIKYKISNRFTYFISLDDDELKKDSKANFLGTTKRIHMKHIPHKEEDSIVDITYIETPGVNTRVEWNQRYEGIFIGEIGIFVIDINELLKLSQMKQESREYKTKVQDIFASLFLWCSFRKKDKVIIAISKTEQSFCADVRCAVDVIQSFSLFRNIRIVPIGIKIEEREDCNIFTNKHCVKGIRQKYNTLMKEIIDLISEKKEKERVGIKFAYINNPSEKNVHGNYFTVKVLSGVFDVGERVKVYPIKRNELGNNEELIFKIKAARGMEDDQIEYTEIKAGNIVNIDTHKINISGTDVSLKEVIFSKSCLLLGEETQYLEGNYLLFKTKLSNKNVFQERYKTLKPMQKVNVVWFGKIITMEIVSRYLEGKYYHLGGVVIDDSIIMPLDKNNNESNLPYKNFTLEIDNSYFFDANLEHIINIDKNKTFSYFYMFDITNNFEVKNDLEGLNCTYKRESYYIWNNYNYGQMKKCMEQLSNIMVKYKINDYDLRIFSYDGESLLL